MTPLKINSFTFACCLYFLLIPLLTITQAQESITPEILGTIEESVTIDQESRAMINAVTNNDIKKLTFNRNALEELDHHFAYRIQTGEVINQKSSGRCWLFTSLNVLRPAVIKKHNLKDFQFSENYLFFYDQLEKSNVFLEAILENLDKSDDEEMTIWLFKNAIGDGGVWNMMVDLIKKYGAVPRTAMLESYSSENTRMMTRLLVRKLREGAFNIREMHKQGQNMKKLRAEKLNILSDIYRILVISLGEPPKTFTWRYETKDGTISPSKTYTPIQFYKEFIGQDVEKYVMMMDDPSKEYYKRYDIQYYRNVWEGEDWTFVNVPSNDLKVFAKKSILADQPMYFSCDVGKQLDSKNGYLALNIYDYDALYGVKFGMDKKARILTYDSGSSHGMALMGIDTTGDGRVTKWLLENSWGEDKGEEGYLTMTDEWFDQYLFRLVVHQNFVSEKIRKIANQKPVMLPPWDPMF
jgi:bleomycin hydrolase